MTSPEDRSTIESANDDLIKIIKDSGEYVTHISCAKTTVGVLKTRVQSLINKIDRLETNQQQLFINKVRSVIVDLSLTKTVLDNDVFKDIEDMLVEAENPSPKLRKGRERGDSGIGSTSSDLLRQEDNSEETQVKEVASAPLQLPIEESCGHENQDLMEPAEFLEKLGVVQERMQESLNLARDESEGEADA